MNEIINDIINELRSEINSLKEHIKFQNKSIKDINKKVDILNDKIQTISPLGRKGQKQDVTIEDVKPYIEACIEHFDIDPTIRSRSHNISHPRMVIYAILLKKYTSTSIARVFETDHSTVLTCSNKVYELLVFGDEKFQKYYDILKEV